MKVRDSIRNRIKDGAAKGQVFTESFLENLFCLFLVLFLLLKFVSTTTIGFRYLLEENYVLLLSLLAAAGFARICASKCYTSAEILICTLLALLFLLAIYCNHNAELLEVLVVILGAKDIPFEKLLRLFFCTIGGAFLLTVLSAGVGLIENYMPMREDHSLRMSLGIAWPTDCAAYAFYLSLVYVYLRRKSLRIRDGIGILLVGAVFFYFTDGRVSFFCMCLLAVGVFAGCAFRGKKIPKVVNVLAVAPLLCAGLSVGLTFLYTKESDFMQLLDTWTSKRLSYGKSGIEQCGISLFGTDSAGIDYDSLEEFFYFDSSYLKALVFFGVLVFTLLLLCMLWLTFRAMKEGNILLLWIWALISLHCMVDLHLTEVMYNPFFWMLFAGKSRSETLDFSPKV